MKSETNEPVFKDLVKELLYIEIIDQQTRLFYFLDQVIHEKLGEEYGEKN